MADMQPMTATETIHARNVYAFRVDKAIHGGQEIWKPMIVYRK